MASSGFIEVQKYLKGIGYPASKQDLLRQAEKNGAKEDVRAALEKLPDDNNFESPIQISRALSQLH